jgi:hypothetical protein
MHKRFLEKLPESIKPYERYNNKKMLEFNNDFGSGLDSAIRVGTADKEDLGSGQLIHNLHLSELAKYPKHSCTSLLLSLLQCVPDHAETEVILESTAKGIGGEFYRRFWDAKYRYVFNITNGKVSFTKEINPDADPNNEYNSIFIPWFVFAEYKMPVRTPLEHTDDEKTLIKLYGLTDEQLQWRRFTLVNKCNNDLNLFNQEYPADPMSAFVSESDNAFDVLKLMERIKVAPDPKTTYNVSPITMLVTHDPKGKLKVWEEPQPSAIYVISGDPAEGIVGRDYTSLQVINISTGKQAATWHGTIAPDQFAGILVAVARRYNSGLIAVERNNHGLGVIDRIFNEFKYNNLYFEMVDEPPAKPRKRFGWVTTKKSKPAIITNLSAEFRENYDGIMDKDLLNEMMFFKQHEDLQYGAEEGQNDDRVISYAIAKFVVYKHPKRLRIQRFDTSPTQTYNNIQQSRNITSASWS